MIHVACYVGDACTPSLREDELVLCSQPQPVAFVAMADDDLARSHEQVAAVEASVGDSDGSDLHGRRLSAVVLGAVVIRQRAHVSDVPNKGLIYFFYVSSLDIF